MVYRQEFSAQWYALVSLASNPVTSTSVAAPPPRAISPARQEQASALVEPARLAFRGEAQGVQACGPTSALKKPSRQGAQTSPSWYVPAKQEETHVPSGSSGPPSGPGSYSAIHTHAEMSVDVAPAVVAYSVHGVQASSP